MATLKCARGDKVCIVDCAVNSVMDDRRLRRSRLSVLREEISNTAANFRLLVWWTALWPTHSSHNSARAYYLYVRYARDTSSSSVGCHRLLNLFIYRSTNAAGRNVSFGEYAFRNDVLH